MASTNSQIRLGYYIPQRKLAKMNFKELTDYLATLPNVDLKLIDLDKSFDEQAADRHLIFHKVTDELSTNDAEVIAKINRLEEFLKAHSSTIADIDPIENQKKLTDRSIINELLKKIEAETDAKLKFRMPKHVIIEKESQEYDLSSHGISFPVICKTTQACGSAGSHHMGLVFNEKGLHKFQPPFLVQEFYNHNHVIYKVFVVQDFISIVKRPSLPNLPSDQVETVFFDSQKPFAPQLQQLKRASDKTDEQFIQEAELPPMETIEAMSKGIQKHLGLTLFGFDVITQVETGNHAVVDINYFPSYGGVKDFWKIFGDYLVRRAKEKINNRKV